LVEANGCVGRKNRSQPQSDERKPVIKGSAITVESILRKFAEGATEDAVLLDHPQLTRDDVRAAIRYAADMLANGETMATSGQPRGDRREELERMKAARFPAEGKEQRVAAALRALEEFRWKLPLSTEEVRWIAEDPDLEDI
jgi:uncharacterized protein (DUF433 family)